MTCEPTYRPILLAVTGPEAAPVPSGEHGPAGDRAVWNVGRDDRGRGPPARVLRALVRRPRLGRRRTSRPLAHASGVRVDRRPRAAPPLVRLTRMGRRRGPRSAHLARV